MSTERASYSFWSRFLSLRTAITISVILGIGFPGVYLTWNQISRLQESQQVLLQSEADQLADLLAQSMREPLWQFFSEQADAVVEATAVNPRIVEIIVTDAQGDVFAAVNRRVADNDATQRELSETRTISRNGVVIGSILITLSAADQEAEFREVLTERIAVGLLAILASIAVILTLLHYRFVTPISELVQASRRIASGDLSRQISNKRGDEIGELARSLETTRQSLEELFEESRAKNLELELLNFRLATQLNASDAANRAKSDFLATMSHELRTPLNAIIGFSDVISQEVVGPIGTRRYLEYASDINNSGRHLLDMISDILEITRIEKGVKEFEVSSFSLTEIGEECIKQVSILASDQQVILTTEFEEDLPQVHSDARGIRQILINLLSNAVKFSDVGGLVILAIKRLDGDNLQCTVTDHGEGIPPHMVDRLGTPFHTIGTPTRSDQTGLGLGLSISKTLAAGLGGDIRIESVFGEGTSVSVTLKQDIRPFLGNPDHQAAETTGTPAPD